MRTLIVCLLCVVLCGCGGKPSQSNQPKAPAVPAVPSVPDFKMPNIQLPPTTAQQDRDAERRQNEDRSRQMQEENRRVKEKIEAQQAQLARERQGREAQDRARSAEFERKAKEGWKPRPKLEEPSQTSSYTEEDVCNTVRNAVDEPVVKDVFDRAFGKAYPQRWSEYDLSLRDPPTKNKVRQLEKGRWEVQGFGGLYVTMDDTGDKRRVVAIWWTAIVAVNRDELQCVSFKLDHQQDLGLRRPFTEAVDKSYNVPLWEGR